MRIILILFIAFQITFSAQAQQITLKQFDQPMTLPTGVDGIAKVEGNPFLNEKYVPVILNNMDGSNMELDQGRFNAFAQKIEVVKGDQKIWVNDHKLAGFTLVNKGVKQKFVRFNINQNTHYLEELATGSHPLLMLSTIAIIEPKKDDNTSYNTSNSNTYTYAKPKTVFYTVADTKLVEVNTSKNKLIDSFAQKYQAKISSKIKRDKLRTGKVEDLTKIFEYYNTLLASN